MIFFIVLALTLLLLKIFSRLVQPIDGYSGATERTEIGDFASPFHAIFDIQARLLIVNFSKEVVSLNMEIQ